MLYRKWLIVCLIFILPILAACGGAENKGTEAPIESNLSEPLILSETYVGENMLVNATLTVSYPSGWVARGNGTQLLLANQDPEQIDEDSDSLLILILPVEGEMLPNRADTTARSLLESAALEGVITLGVITETMIQGNDAAFASGEAEEDAALVYAIQFDAEVFIVVTAIKRGELTDGVRTTIDAIVTSIVYSAGEIPQNDQ